MKTTWTYSRNLRHTLGCVIAINVCYCADLMADFVYDVTFSKKISLDCPV